MEGSNKLNSVGEYERNLLSVRSYIKELVDYHDVDICQSWIEKLTSCAEDEINLHNEYMNALRYQLSNGILKDPFLELPPKGKLSPYPDNDESDYCNNGVSDPELLRTESNCDGHEIDNEELSCNLIEKKETELNFDSLPEMISTKAETIILGSDCASSCASQVSESLVENINTYTKPLNNKGQYYVDDNLDKRANDLIMKLREMKRQNSLLNKELLAMRAEMGHVQICQRKGAYKYDFHLSEEDDARNISDFYDNSNNVLAYFNEKIAEMENFSYFLLDSLDSFEEKLRQIDDEEKYNIKKMISKYKIEVEKIKISVRNELKESFEKDIKELKQMYDNKIKQTELNILQREQETITAKNKIIKEKDELLTMKDIAIGKLEVIVEEQRSNLKTTINRLSDKANSECNTDSLQNKVYRLERQLVKADRSKKKYIHLYESRIARLEREKHYLMYNFQLQLIRQKTYQASDTATETHSKLNAVFSKLESKYREVVTNMQATAIKRRMQDQLALESILLASYGNAENGDEESCVKESKNPARLSRDFDEQNLSKSLSDESANSK
ncbi:hypothetical protein EVAR_59684_1 [Eumeta japonica]|uniref:DUF4485 domain-containing protein n=1 Tax=Eumeta variegata TaxID=151549 RepID=A0A4C1Z242_EUMVA|nr:hypothetical protein EVAR_59684_1 [Eumeta japonica]